MIRANTRNRIQAISIDGSVVDRYFAVTSEVPRNTVEARISAMPLNGRSVRAGRGRATDFFSGNGNARSSLAAAMIAGRGVTAGLRRKTRESNVLVKKRQMLPADNTRSRDADMRVAG